jgi:hypothetical protein
MFLPSLGLTYALWPMIAVGSAARTTLTRPGVLRGVRGAVHAADDGQRGPGLVADRHADRDVDVDALVVRDGVGVQLLGRHQVLRVWSSDPSYRRGPGQPELVSSVVTPW